MNRLSERSIRFLHLADLHFGMENHGRIDPETGIHSRLLDFSATLERILDRALEMEIDAVLFAGDAYRTGRPTPTQERELARHIERIGRAGLPGTSRTFPLWSFLPVIRRKRYIYWHIL